MIFAHHNFTSNFLNAVGYNDQFMAENIILDEIARLIVEDKKDLISLLRKEGLNVTINMPNNIVGDVVAREIENENSEVIKWVSERITNNRFDDSEAKSILNASGKERKFGSKLGKLIKDDKFQEGASQLTAGLLKNIFNKRNKKKSVENSEVLDERLKINEMQKVAATNKKKKRVKMIILGSSLAVAGALTFLAIRITNKRKKIESSSAINEPVNTPADG